MTPYYIESRKPLIFKLRKSFDRTEKILLLDVLMRDMHMDWTEESQNRRLNYALQLANELCFLYHIRRIVRFRNMGSMLLHFNYFNVDFEDGGFKNAQEFHGLPYHFKSRSRKFKKLATKLLKRKSEHFTDL